MSATGTGLTTTRVPGGIVGAIDPVSITYGVAPASRGTISATSRVAPTESMTNQDPTSPTQRSHSGAALFVSFDISSPFSAIKSGASYEPSWV